MKAFGEKIWYSEPVRVLGGLTAAWTAVAGFDKASDEFSVPVWGYVVATAAIPFLTSLVRGKVTPGA